MYVNQARKFVLKPQNTKSSRNSMIGFLTPVFPSPETNIFRAMEFYWMDKTITTLSMKDAQINRVKQEETLDRLW
jgi:hypothetical protein